jgi:protein MPE1
MTPQEVRETQPSDPDLACPICKKVIWEAVKTPCCSTSYCEECVTNWLMDHEFVCESCESKVGSLEELVPDEELREKVGEYIEGEIVRSKREKEEEDEQAGIVGGDQAEPDAEGSSEVKAEPEHGEEGASQEEKDKKVCSATELSGSS